MAVALKKIEKGGANVGNGFHNLLIYQEAVIRIFFHKYTMSSRIFFLKRAVRERSEITSTLRRISMPISSKNALISKISHFLPGRIRRSTSLLFLASPRATEPKT